MSDKKRKVPKLRFPGFTDSWEQRKLGEVVFRRNAAEVTGALPGVEYEDVIPEEGRLNKNVSLKEVTKKGLEFLEGDVLFGKLRPYLKNWLFAEFNGVAVGDWWVLYSDKVDGRLIYYLIQTDSYQTVANLSTGTKMPRSDWTTVSQTIFAFPVSADEQLKIGKYFSSIDSLISLHQRKLDNVKMLKKSLLQKLFPKDGEKTPELRFPGFTDAWEQRKLIDYLEVSKEKNKDGTFDKEDVLSVSGFYGIVNQIEFQGRSFAGSSVANYGVVKNGDVVYTKSPLKSNPYGIIKTNKGNPGVVSTLYAVYRPLKNTHSDFIQTYFEQDARMNNYMSPLVNKGAKNDMKVSDENALKGEVIFPSKEEQVKISDYFEMLNKLLSLHQRKLDHLKELKKGLLQQMFV